MKITEAETLLLEVPHAEPHQKAWSVGVEHARLLTLVILRSDGGARGYGIGCGDSRGAVAAAAEPLIGKPLPDLRSRPDPASTMSRVHEQQAWALDMAMCDLAGKEAGAPLFELWAPDTAPERPPRALRAYVPPVVARTLEDRAAHALAMRERGFTAIKLRAAHATVEEDVAMVQAVRNAVGDTMDILVDANMAAGGRDARPDWDLPRALRTAEKLAALDVVWLEEPLPREQIADLEALTRRSPIRIAGGEGDHGLAAQERLLASDAYHVLQPDAASTAGLSAMRGWAAAAARTNRWFVPHHGGSALGMAAHLHLGATLTNSPYVEYMLDPPWRTMESFQMLHGVFPEPIPLQADGSAVAPDGPGFGLPVDEAAARRLAVV